MTYYLGVCFLRIETEIKLDFADVLIRPKRSTLTSRADVTLEREFSFLHSPKKWKGVPIVAANMDSTGTFEMARALSTHGMITALHKYYSVDELEKFFAEFNQPSRVAFTLGIRDEDFAKLAQVKKRDLGKYFDFIVLDVPNGYLGRFVDAVKHVRKEFPQHIIVAGNVVTNEMTEELLLEGADIVKVGIGPGGACTTRRKTGVGYPQLSATIECADAAHGISSNSKEKGCGLIMTDGGFVYSSCIAKAFCGGADFVMSGTMLASFDQSGGELVERDGKKYKHHFGSSSSEALKKYYGKIDAHRASEGRDMYLPYQGDIHPFLLDVLGSLRSTATYIGARTLKEFSRRATFLHVSRQLNDAFEQYDKE